MERFLGRIDRILFRGYFQIWESCRPFLEHLGRTKVAPRGVGKPSPLTVRISSTADSHADELDGVT